MASRGDSDVRSTTALRCAGPLGSACLFRSGHSFAGRAGKRSECGREEVKLFSRPGARPFRLRLICPDALPPAHGTRVDLFGRLPRAQASQSKAVEGESNCRVSAGAEHA